jgi:hypothetical protein
VAQLELVAEVGKLLRAAEPAAAQPAQPDGRPIARPPAS